MFIANNNIYEKFIGTRNGYEINHFRQNCRQA